ncbi:MAG: MFS transporter [Bacteroidota bacterium]|jgi:FHS family L-fucose permease-like MFS transporter
MNGSKHKNYTTAFSILISVFFFWGFVAASNDILIPVFKEKLMLQQWQSQLISLAFYISYTIGSIGYILISGILKKDLLAKLGYKNGIALGLAISAIGTFLFYPAAEMSSFYIMITGLFIVGLGFSLQQTAANPLAIVMGDPAKGSQRLSLAGGINNFGTTIGPLIISYAIFGTIGGNSKPNIEIESIKLPYMILGGAFLVVAAVFRFSPIPDVIETSEENNNEKHSTERKHAIFYPQLLMGMLAIFVYVGVEVSTASNLPEFMRQQMKNYSTDKVAPFVSLFWASLMMGRWTSSVGAFNLNSTAKNILQFFMPYIAFGVFLLVNLIAGYDISSLYVYGVLILILVAGDFLSKGNPAKQLLIYSVLGILALLVGIFSSGMTSVFAFISVGLFCSTLWPCIFTLAITGLGKKTNQGSGMLIMMIMGGGLVSFLQGLLSNENLLGIQYSYLVGVACFIYLAIYAAAVPGILKKQGVDLTDSGSKISH